VAKVNLQSPAGEPVEVDDSGFKRIAIIETPSNWQGGICLIRSKFITTASCQSRVVLYGSKNKVLTTGVVSVFMGAQNYTDMNVVSLPQGRALVVLEARKFTAEPEEPKCFISDYILSLYNDYAEGLSSGPQKTQISEPGYRRKLDLD
jgi:hypothetical protein